MKITRFLFTLLLLLMIVGCGDTARNQRGVSFIFFGWFEDDQGDSGIVNFLGDFDSFANGTVNPADYLAYMGVQNMLTEQFITLSYVKHEYEVVGTGIPLPTQFIRIAGTLGPSSRGEESETSETGAGESTLPNGFIDNTNITPVGFIGTTLFGGDILRFIDENPHLFPKRPFAITVTSTVAGVDTAGFERVTNPVVVDVVMS